MNIDRRDWMKLVGAMGVGAAAPGLLRANTSEKNTLSIGTYSMKGMTLEQGIAVIAETGYDGIEIAVMPKTDAEPASMPTARRSAVQKLLKEKGLRLTAIMENMSPAQDDKAHQADVARLKQVFAMAHELATDDTPPVQTVLGGGKWDEKKNLFRDRLGDWLAAAVAANTTLAIKPHRFGAMSKPADAIWLIEQLGNSPRLRMVYDYSHYAFRDLPVDATVKESLPYLAHVAVKDAVQQGDKVGFMLPGEGGTFDYAKLLRLLYDGGYRGDICVEVSAQVSGKPGYDPKAAAKTSYQNMAKAFEAAGVPRG